MTDSPMQFYKTCCPRLIEAMLTMFSCATETGRLPESLEQALIIVLPKPGNDPELCSSYRPISILPSEYKMFSKIFALWLEKDLPDIISMDQTWFIQNRSSIDNVRRFFNIIHSSKSDQHPCVTVSLEAEKVFWDKGKNEHRPQIH